MYGNGIIQKTASPYGLVALMISWFYEPLPQKYAMGSDWLAGPVCCGFTKLPSAVQKHHAPHLSGMCSGCIVNNDVVNIVYQFVPDRDTENISEEDHAEPVQARLLQDVSEWYVFLGGFLSHTFRYSVICKCYCLC